MPVSSRGAVPLAIASAFLIIGFALVLIGALLPELQPLPLDDLAEAANRAAAWEFYTAQNAALTTGDGSRLTAALDPNFVDHQLGTVAEQDRADLVGELSALRSTQPGIRLAAEPLLVAGDRVLVSVQMRPGHAVSLASATSTPQSAPSETIEVVRVAGGVIAERWSLDGVGMPLAAPVTPTAVPSESSRFVTATAEGLVCLASGCH
jgi:hypothetical protein